MYKQILVPLDGSPFGEQALPMAAAVARRSGAAVQLASVYASLGSIFVEGHLFPNDQVDENLRRQQRGYLARMVERVRALTPTPVSFVVLEGATAEALRQHVKGTDTDLIVMTTHARGPFSRFWVGSVADDLLRDAPTPILLVRPTGEAVDWKADPLPRHYLVPLDGSVQAEQVLEPALALGSLNNAAYTLVRVIRPILPMQYHVEGGSLEKIADSLIAQIEQAHLALRTEARDYLEKVAVPLRQRSLVVNTEVAVEEHPARAILEHAVAPVGGIALRTHARHGLARLFLGSVTDKVIRGGHLPVLVQPPRA